MGGGAEEWSGMKKGPWTAAEDAILMEYVKKHGEGNWNAVQKNSGLSRCGKSCRLRWANHLRPNLKKGALSPDEECLILQLHSELGNKWARMAAQVSYNSAIYTIPLLSSSSAFQSHHLIIYRSIIFIHVFIVTGEDG